MKCPITECAYYDISSDDNNCILNAEILGAKCNMYAPKGSIEKALKHLKEKY